MYMECRTFSLAQRDCVQPLRVTPTNQERNKKEKESKMLIGPASVLAKHHPQPHYYVLQNCRQQ